MTFHEQLKKHLTTKQYVLIQNDDGNYRIFSHIKDHNGSYRQSNWCSTKEETMQYIGDKKGYKPEQLNELAEQDNWKILEAFDIPQEQFKKGEVVVIADNAKKLCQQVGLGWSSLMDEMIGKECEVKEVKNNHYNIYPPDSTIYWALPHSALSYPIQEEQKPKEITVDGAIYRLVE